MEVGRGALERFCARGSRDGLLGGEILWRGWGQLLAIESHFAKRRGGFLSRCTVEGIWIRRQYTAVRSVRARPRSSFIAGKHLHNLIEIADDWFLVSRACGFIVFQP